MRWQSKNRTPVMPLMKPAIAVQAIFTFVSSWNNYFTPALILHEPKMRTVPILIAQLRSMDWSNLDTGVVYAMIGLSIFPVIIVYMAGFINGITMELKVLNSPEPSIRAASINDSGNELSIYCFI